MRLPIQYALTYPERWEGIFRSKIDYAKLGSFNFEPVDLDRFRCLKIAREAAVKGGTYPAVLCAADEVAVELFLTKKIGFLGIADLVAKTMEHHNVVSQPSLDDIMAADTWTRHAARAGF